MKINKISIWAGLISSLFASQVFANVKLPKFVSDNMVLQRDIKIPVWGWADQGESVTIKFLNKTYTATPDASGKWTLSLPPTPAGGPYEISVKGKNEIIIKNVLVGDVWVCGGQSNMEWTLESCKGRYTQEIAKTNNPNIRQIKVKNTASIVPLTDIETEGWKLAIPENLPKFSAVGYFFAKEIYQNTKVPIGLIADNWGGSSAETWMSPDALKSYPNYVEEYAKYEDFQKTLYEWQKDADKMDIAAQGDTTWAKSNADLAQWKTMKLPGNWEKSEIGDFDGVVWFKKEVKLPVDAAGQDLVLYLSNIDDDDISWFNGIRVGKTSGYEKQRKYTVPGKLVKGGTNIIAIRVSDYFGGGGVSGNAPNFKLEVKAPALSNLGNWSYALPLDGDWSFKVSSEYKGLTAKPWTKQTFRWEANLPTLLYKGMINPILPYAIKGAIWYQGETNASIAYEYRKLFPSLIANWREKWGQGNFPFLFVQLANYMKAKSEPSASAWAELREAQSMTLDVPNTAMATIIDIGDADDIHPTNKEDVGKRLAYGGLKVAYGKDLVYSGPTYDAMKIEGGKIKITFKNTGAGIIAKGAELKEFAIAGEDKKFVWAKATIEGNTVTVWADEIKSPVAVRYAWADNPDKANFYNKEGIPASPFRTDDWKGVTQP